MIDLSIHPDRLERAVQRARERNIVIPTFDQMRDPAHIPDSVKTDLEDVGLWDLDPRNLFRINWHNEPVEKGGGFGGVNYLVVPPELTGIEAKIVVVLGKWFPTGAHKVGAAFGCLVPPLVTGQFDPTSQKAAWPSTGNYCRGGAYDSNLLGCESIAILPEGMSRERFEWLATVAGEVIKTPGSESNVKEIFDKCKELEASGEDIAIFNQFDQFGNYLWHWAVTGPAIEEAVRDAMGPNDTYRGVASNTGSAGTIGCGDYLKQAFGGSFITASEALQCPTMLTNGFGSHRIEGIGDKHIPWIHNVRNTDFITAIDDNATMAIMRLFNEPAGQEYLVSRGMDQEFVEHLPLFGISGIANVLSAIKTAKWLELGPTDVVATIATDAMELYRSRLAELAEDEGPFGTVDAAVAYERYLLGTTTDFMGELDYPGRKRVHNLKYFTWVEQQGKTSEELDSMWDPAFWTDVQASVAPIDEMIVSFNEAVSGG